MSRPQVLMLTTTLPAHEGDGTPEFVLSLAQHMDAEVTIVAPRVRGCSLRQEMNGVSIRRFRYAPKFLESLADDAIVPALSQRPLLAIQVPGLVAAMAWTAWQAQRELDPDVIHAHWVIPAGVIGSLLNRNRRSTLIVTAHGADAFALGDPVSRTVKRFVLRKADRVHAVSTDIADKLRAVEPNHVAQVLPIGVDVSAVATATANRSPNGRLLFVGRLAEKKGVDVLLHALARLRDEEGLCPGVDIIGDGPMRTELESLATGLGLDQVRFVGVKSRDEVLEYYRTSEMLVMPSKTASNGDRDGTPVVLMEAIAAGVPVVATDIGGIGELLEDQQTAWLLAEDDVPSLQAAIADALDNPGKRTSFATACLSKRRDRIDISKIAHSLLDRVA